MGNKDGEGVTKGEGAEPTGRDDAGPVQSVDRAVASLEILARDGEGGVTEVARANRASDRS